MAKRRNQKQEQQKASRSKKPRKPKTQPVGDGSFSAPKRKARPTVKPPPPKRQKKEGVGREESGETPTKRSVGGSKRSVERSKGKGRFGGVGLRSGRKGMKSVGGKNRRGVKEVRMKKSEVKARIREHKSLIKKNFGLVQEVVALWEKLRPSKVTPAQKSVVVKTILEKTKGKIPELVKNHRASRVVQFCLKEGSDLQRKQIMQEVQESILDLSKDKYGKHLVLKLIKCMPEEHTGPLVKLFRGQVVVFLRHNYGTDVIAELYHNASKEDQLLMQLECYSTELSLQQQALLGDDNIAERVRKGLDLSLESVLVHLDQARRASIFRDLTQNINHILEKGLLHPELVHIIMKEYLNSAPSALVEDLVIALADTGDGIMKMLHTREGATVAAMALVYGTSKVRKLMVKGLKGYVSEIAIDEWGHTVLITALRVVDDTTLLNKVIVEEIKGKLMDICKSQYGSRVILSIINPESVACMPKEVMDIVEPKERRIKRKKAPEDPEQGDQEEEIEEEEEHVLGQSLKNPLTRFHAILTDGAHPLKDAVLNLCISDGDVLLRSQFGSNVWFEVVSGGTGAFNAAVEKSLDALNESTVRLCLEPVEPEEISTLDEAENRDLSGQTADIKVSEECDASDSEVSQEESDEEDMGVLPDTFEADADTSSLEEVSIDGDKDDKANDSGPQAKTKKLQKYPRAKKIHIFKSWTGQNALQRLIGMSSDSRRGEIASRFVRMLWEGVFKGRSRCYVGEPGEFVLVSLLNCGVEEVEGHVRDEVSAVLKEPIDEWIGQLKKIQDAHKTQLWTKTKRRKRRRKVNTEDKASKQ